MSKPQVGDLIPIGAVGDAQKANVLEGKTFSSEIEGVEAAGTMPSRGAISKTITTQNGQITIPPGHHNGSGIVKASFANLIAENVKKGLNIGDIIGTLEPKKYATGSKSATRKYYSDGQNYTFVMEVSGLQFRPIVILMQYTSYNYPDYFGIYSSYFASNKFCYWDNYSGGSCYRVINDNIGSSSSAFYYVIDGAFCLPPPYSGGTFSHYWVALG